MYIINVFFSAKPGDGFNACNDEPVHHIFAGDPLYLLDEAFEVSEAVFAVLYLVNDCYNPSFEGIVTLSVGDGYDFLLVDLTIRFANLTVW